MRARRSDRTHIIYEILGDQGSYIGVTAKTESTILKSLNSRVAKHWYRAHAEAKDWLLCQYLRSISDRTNIDVRVLELIRGKATAHQRERELIRQRQPYYNTDRRQRAA